VIVLNFYKWSLQPWFRLKTLPWHLSFVSLSSTYHFIMFQFLFQIYFSSLFFSSSFSSFFLHSISWSFVFLPLHPLLFIATHLQILVLRELAFNLPQKKELGFKDNFFYFIGLFLINLSLQIRGTLWSIKYFVSGIIGYMHEWSNWSHCALISFALGKIKSFLVEKNNIY